MGGIDGAVQGKVGDRGFHRILVSQSRVFLALCVWEKGKSVLSPSFRRVGVVGGNLHNMT